MKSGMRPWRPFSVEEDVVGAHQAWCAIWVTNEGDCDCKDRDVSPTRHLTAAQRLDAIDLDEQAS